MQIHLLNNSNLKSKRADYSKQNPVYTSVPYNNVLAKDTVTFGAHYKDVFKLQIEKFPQDKAYRKDLAKTFGVKEGQEYLLRPIIGLQEFTDAVKTFDNKHYMSGITTKFKNDFSFVKSGDFRANLHCHTKHSDGDMTVKELLDQAVKMADLNAKLLKKDSLVPNAPFIVGITDHNELEGCLEAVNIIKENPYKYRNLRVILGCEVTAQDQKNIPTSHILIYGINPYNKKLNEDAPKSRGFSDIINHFSGMEYGAIGLAHPIRTLNGYRDIHGAKSTEEFIDNLFGEFKKQGGDKAIFVENHYQSYHGDFEKNLEISKNLSDKYGFISTGGYDSHGNNIISGTMTLSENHLITVFDKNIK